MKTFCTMLAMTALATGTKINGTVKSPFIPDYAQINDDFPFAQIMVEESKSEETASNSVMTSYANANTVFGGKKIVKCGDGSFRACTTGTRNGCSDVCDATTGYEIAIACLNTMSFQFC